MQQTYHERLHAFQHIFRLLLKSNFILLNVSYKYSVWALVFIFSSFLHSFSLSSHLISSFYLLLLHVYSTFSFFLNSLPLSPILFLLHSIFYFWIFILFPLLSYNSFHFPPIFFLLLLHSICFFCTFTQFFFNFFHSISGFIHRSDT